MKKLLFALGLVLAPLLTKAQDWAQHYSQISGDSVLNDSVQILVIDAEKDSTFYMLTSQLAALWQGDDISTITGLTGTAYRIFATNGSGDVTEIGLGTSGQVLMSNGASSLPSFQDEAGGEGGGWAVNDSAEILQDLIGAMFSGNTETGISATYQDGDGTIDLVVSGGAGYSQEEIEDFIGAMVSGNTESNISVTYEDADGTLDFVVSGAGSGDMSMSTYDTDEDDVVDNAEALGGTAANLFYTAAQVRAIAQDSADQAIVDALADGVDAVAVADTTGTSEGHYMPRREVIDSLSTLRTLAGSGGGSGVSQSEFEDSISALRLVIDELSDSITAHRAEILSLWTAIGNLGDVGDVTAPTLSSVELGTYNDSILLAIFSENLDADSVATISDFTLTEDGTTFGLNTVSISYDSLFISLDSAGVYGSTYLLDYSQGTPVLQDSSENLVVAFTDEAVTNNVEDQTPSGNNMLSNGDFSSGATDWWINPDCATLSGGAITYDNSEDNVAILFQESSDMNSTIQASTDYTLEFDLTNNTGGAYIGIYSDTTGSHVDYIPISDRGTGDNHYSIDFTTGFTVGGFAVYVWLNGGFTIDNIELYEDETP